MINKVNYVIENNQLKECKDENLNALMKLFDRGTTVIEPLIFNEYLYSDIGKDINDLLNVLNEKDKGIVLYKLGLNHENLTFSQSYMSKVFSKARIKLILYNHDHHVLFKWKNKYKTNTLNLELILKEDISKALNHELDKTKYLNKIIKCNQNKTSLIETHRQLEKDELYEINLSTVTYNKLVSYKKTNSGIKIYWVSTSSFLNFSAFAIKSF